MRGGKNKQAAYEYAQVSKGQGAANHILDTKSHYGTDLATIMVRRGRGVLRVPRPGASSAASLLSTPAPVRFTRRSWMTSADTRWRVCVGGCKVSYLDKVQAVQWDGMSQTASAILMELTSQAVPVYTMQIKCCAFQEACGRLFDLWQVRFDPCSRQRVG